eukprot:15471916-Alexandrium_andersonii.AAC.1
MMLSAPPVPYSNGLVRSSQAKMPATPSGDLPVCCGLAVPHACSLGGPLRRLLRNQALTLQPCVA